MPRGIYPRAPSLRAIRRENQISKFWTDSRIDKLKIDWESGREINWIAAELGCSRNSVIGKAHRLALSTRVVGKKPGKAYPAVKRGTVAEYPKIMRSKVADRKAEKAKQAALTTSNLPNVKQSNVIAIAVRAEVPDTSTNCSLLALTVHSCRWPMGEAREDCYCGKFKDDILKPYCAYHARAASRNYG